MREIIIICFLLFPGTLNAGQKPVTRTEGDEENPASPITQTQKQTTAEELNTATDAEDGKKSDPRNEMDLSIDIGYGFLEFFHFNASYLISRSWSVGLGLGFFPIEAMVTKLMEVDDLATEADIEGFHLEGEVGTSVSSGQIFFRNYYWAERFFMQGSLAVWTLEAHTRGALEHEDLPAEIELTAKARVWVPMLGFSTGWRFLWEIGAYLDLGLGVNFMFSPGAKVKFGGETIDDARKIPTVGPLIDDAEEFLTDSLKDGANRITEKLMWIPIPTLALRFGWAFDAW